MDPGAENCWPARAIELESPMSNKYVELGAGFFLTDIDSFTLEVCDANSARYAGWPSSFCCRQWIPSVP